MTLQQMQEASKRRNEAIVGAWTKKPTGLTDNLLQNYRLAYSSINKELQATYAKLLSGVEPDKYYSVMTQYNRLKTLQASISKDYTAAARQAAKDQFAMSELSFSNAYYENQYSVNWFANNGYYSTMDKKALEVSVYGTDEIWQSIKASNRQSYGAYLPKYGTLSSLLEANATADLKRINQAVTQGLRKGESYNSIAVELRKIFNTTASNAVRIARTEGNRTLNSGAYANSVAAAESGVGMERMYLATQDSRTREQSGAMDGQTVPVDEPFKYGGLEWYIPGNSGNPAYDINDRCTAIDQVEGKPPEIRRGRNPVTGKTEVASFSTFDGWMKEHNLTRNNSGRIISK